MAEASGGWSDSERAYLVALSHDFQLGWVRLSSLYGRFGSWEKIWQAGRSRLMRAGLSKESAERIVDFTHSSDPAKMLKRIGWLGIGTTCMGDVDYPSLLAETDSPPATLFYRGSLEALRADTLAVVGTRKVSAYGEEAIEHLVPSLVRSGMTIVSGLALGIDARAHEATLRSGGYTVAVVGSGLDTMYPISNSRLAEAIVKRGAIVSEYPPGVPALRHHFPIRNRIISGLTRGTLIVEAGYKSGSLITAKYALSQNREVFAVPGSIFSPMSFGTNQRIQAGAKAVLTASDILVELGYESGGPQKLPLPDNPQEATILSVLQGGPAHIETLITACGMSAAKLQQTLTLMEIEDKVRHQGGGFYRIRR